MTRFAIAMVLVSCFIFAVGASAEEPCWQRYDFCQDPELQVWPNVDGSNHHYIYLDAPTLVPEGGYIAVRFCVTDYAHPSLDHSSLMGPLVMGDDSYYPTVRLNLHYTASVPEFSIHANGVSSPRYTLQIGQDYCANLIRSGDMAEVELYEMIGDSLGALVFTYALAADWPTFDRFLVGYDYYAGGYCLWNELECTIDVRSDRSTSYIEYSISSLTMCDVGPSAVEATTWGGIKSLYR